MNIQITSLYYYPENFLINDIAASLVKKGHSVNVLTAVPDYATSRVPSEYKWWRKRKEIIDGVNVRRMPLIARRKGLLFRILNYLSFTISMSAYAFFTRNTQFDVILSNMTSPIFQTIPSIVFKKRTKKKLVMYCYDIWPECLKAWNVKEDSLIFKIVKRISSWVYRQCDIIAITSTPFREYLIDVCNVEDSRIIYLPQYTDDIYKDIVGQYEEDGCIDFLFAGNLGAVQNIDCIFQAAALVKTNRNFCIHIVGDGSEHENLKQLANSLDISGRVCFHGRHPSEEMNRFYKTAECFLLTLRGGDFIGMTLPGKAQGYLCAGKPILAAIDGAGREMIEEADCGEVVPAGDYEALSIKMKFIIENFELYKQKGLNGRNFYEENYTKKIFLNNLENILEDATRG